MKESELKTSPKQRILIGLIAIVMLGSVVASYLAVMISNNSSSSASSQGISSAKAAEYETAYSDKRNEFKAATTSEYATFSKFLPEIKAYNETSVNTGDLSVQDLLVGDGRELADGDTDYLAFYVGWCADEKIFSSSLDDAKNPTGFNTILDAKNPMGINAILGGTDSAEGGLVEGWRVGIVGTRLGGVRIITIPSELAFSDSDNAEKICGVNKPVKFMVMPVANEDPLKTMAGEVEEAYYRYFFANNGIDYDEFIKSSE